MKLQYALTTGILAIMAGHASASELDVMWYLSSDAEEQVIKDVLATYTEAHPETTFNLQIVPYDGIDNRFAQLASAGSLPDISKTTSMRPFIRPFLTDLAPTLGADFLDQFNQGLAAGAKLGDQIIAAPLDLTAIGMLLNVDTFNEAGIEIPPIDQPWTWDEFLANAKEASEAAGIRYPLVWDVSASRWLTFEFQYGNHLFSEEEPYEVVFDQDKATATLDKFIEIADVYMPAGLFSGSSSDNPKSLFLNNQAVAWMSGSWQVPSLAADADFTWSAGPTPYGTVQSSMVGGDYVVGFNTSEHADEATAFIEWLTATEEGQSAFNKPLFLIPANLDIPAIDYGDATVSEALQRFQAELTESPVYAATDQGNPAMQYVWDPIIQSVNQVAAGQISSADAIAKIRKAAEDALAADAQ
ncbi:UNVERIFIED_ORG: carbohydrate ABC transporter substrate-binding protein (CUT1 family) [Martelella mediterranea]